MPPKRSISPKPVKRAAKSRAAAASPEPIVSADQKRELILAHAAMRNMRDPQQLVSVWSGVAAAFVVIVSAWWWLAQPAYTQLLARSSDPGVQDMKKLTADFGAQATQDLAAATQRLSALQSQVSRDQQTLDLMASLVTQSATSTLFVATSTTSTPTSTKNTRRTYAN